jgi:hypothetical protein
MIEHGAARMLFADLHEISLEYFLIGGVACDALRSQFTRDHKDIDILVRAAHISKMLDRLPAHYEAFRKGNLYLLKAPGLEVDVCELIENDDHLIIDGNKAVTKYPKEAFAKPQYASFPGRMVRVASNEVLVATARFGTQEDREFLATRPYDRELVGRIIDTPKLAKDYELERLY